MLHGVLLAVVVVLHLAWRLVRNFVVRSPLDNLPGPPSKSAFAGNMKQLHNLDGWDYLRSLAENYGPIVKLNAFLGSRLLLVHDTKAMHHIFAKDQDSYDRGDQSMGATKLVLGPGLLATAGDTHRRQRKMLNPVFSAAHMRNLTPVFYDVASKLRTAIESRVRDGPTELDVLSWMGRTALELVGQGIIGYSFDPLVRDSQDEFAEAVKAFGAALSQTRFAAFLLPYVEYFGPAWFRRRLLELFPNRKIQRAKAIVDKVAQRAADIVRAKKAAIKQGDQEELHRMGEGNDVMSILLKANLTASEEDMLPDDQVCAQIATFIVAGVDTTSNAISRVLHLLAQHLDAQQKLRSELLEAQERYGKQVPYDELSALPYLDAICRETLHLHPPIALVKRQARQDTVLPLAAPIRGVDGSTISEVAVPNGTQIIVDLPACNRNKALWGEDAYEWKPERWLQPLPRAVEEARIPGIYSHLTTFISGGRACIGFKFSQLEMKVILLTLISSFKFALAPEDDTVWNFAGIAYPSKSKIRTKPALYLNVSLVNQ